MSFDSSFLHPLDLTRAARTQYGGRAYAYNKGPHLWDWLAVVNGKYHPLDIEQAVKEQYSQDFTAVSTGANSHNWSAFNLHLPQSFVLPVMLVASDLFLSIHGVQEAVNRAKSVLTSVQHWYLQQAGISCRMLEPIVLYTFKSAAEWNELCQRTADPDEHLNFFWESVHFFQQYFNQSVNPNLKYLIIHYTGRSEEIRLGAASAGPYCVVPPMNTSVWCDASLTTLSEKQAACIYGVVHQLGRCFALDDPGLAHPEPAGAEVGLRPGTVERIRESAFFA